MSTQLELSPRHEVDHNPVATSSFPLDYFFTRNVLKPRNVYKPRCLKRKYKKYKLRTDGTEDPDVLNISQDFLSTLCIKSPTKGNVNNINNNIDDLEELWPRNYLFKMARRRLKVKRDHTASVKPVQEAISPATESHEKKQTNAFKLLMNSRNKSIGTNSPGKEKMDDPSETQEIVEKKKMKVKRNLALQKMAEAKGSLKKKEIEEYEEKCIMKKMEDRAERLKNMLVSPPASNNKKVKKVAKKIEKVAKQKVLLIDDSEDSKDGDNVEKPNVPNGIIKQSNTLQLINMFDQEKLSKSPEKRIAKEDKEFLQKLSPSMRKKENMLCYFKKIEKTSDTVEIENDNEEPSSPIFKVKIKTKNKKKIKHKSLSLKKESSADILKDRNENNSSNNEIENVNTEVLNDENKQTNMERRKRKRKEALETCTPENTAITDSTEPINTGEGRPKRNVKRPMKYIDDIQLDSSDEEIFSCKKRKHVENGVNEKSKKASTNEIVVSDEEEPSKSSKKSSIKRHTKLAPIFAVKPQIDPAELEAKQRFLYSGIPEQLKRVIDQQKTTNIEFVETFPVVVHVQQKESVSECPMKALPCLQETESDVDEIQFENNPEDIVRKLTNLSPNLNDVVPKHERDIQKVLKNLKESHPKFPVYRTYRLLRSKKKGDFKDTDLENSVETPTEDVSNDSPDNLTWTDKYKATSSKHLIGNFDTVKELKNWLVPWTERIPARKNDSDSSDFNDSDTNSRDSMKGMTNVLMLTGPVGSGKTLSVYAVAKELSIKVLEVNASSKRTGKIMLQDLQEATQSHKVNRGSSNTENSQKSQDFEDRFVLKPNKRGRKKKSEALLKKTLSSESTDASQDTRTALSLILIDDADIIFEQDDGFSAAITQLVQYSKRPVILICGSLTCPHLQRFYSCGNVLRMQPLLPRILGTWLDIMCLADNGMCWPGFGAKILDHFKGDIRKTINNLQFLMASQKSCENSDSQNTDIRDEDENSSMSWPENEGEHQISQNTDSEPYNYFIGKKLMLQDSLQPLDSIDVWWSLPSLMTTKSTENSQNIRSTVSDLEAISNLMDAISVSDHICHPESRANITSQPWFSPIQDSVSELENLDIYDRSLEVTSDIAQYLVRSSLLETQRVLNTEVKMIQSPDMAAQRDKDRRMSRHDNFSSFVNPSSALDRRALALDYWSSCRQICRVEKGRVAPSVESRKDYIHRSRPY